MVSHPGTNQAQTCFALYTKHSQTPSDPQDTVRTRKAAVLPMQCTPTPITSSSQDISGRYHLDCAINIQVLLPPEQVTSGYNTGLLERGRVAHPKSKAQQNGNNHKLHHTGVEVCRGSAKHVEQMHFRAPRNHEMMGPYLLHSVCSTLRSLGETVIPVHKVLLKLVWPELGGGNVREHTAGATGPPPPPLPCGWHRERGHSQGSPAFRILAVNVSSAR